MCGCVRVCMHVLCVGVCMWYVYLVVLCVCGYVNVLDVYMCGCSMRVDVYNIGFV